MPPAVVRNTTAARSVTFMPMPPATKRQVAMAGGDRSRGSKATAPSGGVGKRGRESSKRLKAAAVPLVAEAVVEPEARHHDEENELEDDLEDTGAMQDDSDADFDLVDEQEEEEDDFDGVGAAAAVPRKPAPKQQPKRQKLILDSDEEDEQEQPSKLQSHVANVVSEPTGPQAPVPGTGSDDNRGSGSDKGMGTISGSGQHPVASQFGEAEAVEEVARRGTGEGVKPVRGKKRDRESERENVLEDEDEPDDFRLPCDDGESIQRSATGMHPPTQFCRHLQAQLLALCLRCGTMQRLGAACSHMEQNHQRHRHNIRIKWASRAKGTGFLRDVMRHFPLTVEVT